MRKFVCSVCVLFLAAFMISLSVYAVSPDEKLAATWGKIKSDAGSAKAAPPKGVVEAKSVRALPVNQELELWVFVFPKEDAEKGKGGKPAPAQDICFDGDQTGYKLLSFKPNKDGLTFNINDESISINKTSAIGAIHASFDAWDNVTPTGLFIVQNSGGASHPDPDGNNTVGWTKITPTNILAATWIWVYRKGNIIAQADIFLNLYYIWAVFEVCNEQTAFEVGNIMTHEVGHVVAQDHTKDANGYSTMYPYGSSGEVRKRSLTTGDKSGLAAALKR